MEKYMEQNLASSLDQLASSAVVNHQRPAMNNPLLLVAAICLALDARNPYPRSPAYAVQCIRRETSAPDEPVLHWIQRFLNMSGGDYSIRWDAQLNAWSVDPEENSYLGSPSLKIVCTGCSINGTLQRMK
jgi:hypothetical protein